VDGLASAVRRGWEAFAALTATSSSYHRADRALTLHMLQGLAPGTFAALRLKAPLARALRELTRVPRAFPDGLDEYESMARLDALYLRRIRALPVPRFSKAGLRRQIADQHQRGNDLHAWLMAGLARPLGVELEVTVRWMCRLGSPLVPLYELTHLVLLETDYLRAPLPAERAAELAPRLEEGVAWAAARELWDVLGELAFCLAAAGRSPPDAVVAALLAAQQPDGHFEQAGTTGPDAPRERAHCTATCLLALAAVSDRPGR